MRDTVMDLDRIRGDFPLLSQSVYDAPLAYLDNAATTQKPAVVLEAIQEFYTTGNANIHRGAHYLGDLATAAYERARTTVKEYINAEHREEIIFTRGTTDAINIVASSFSKYRFKEGDEIVVSTMEHHSNLVPWQELCERQRLTLKPIPLHGNGAPVEAEALEAQISGRTKLIALTYVSNVLGAVNPIKELIALAHANGVPVLVDAAQAVQHMTVDVQDLDCDFLAFSGHKIYAATGIGVLYGKRELLESMPPAQLGGGMIESVCLTGTKYAAPPQKFEAGTPPIGAAVTLTPALRYVQELGFDWISRHEDRLMRYCENRMNELDWIISYGPEEHRQGVISFNIQDVNPYDAGLILDKMGIAVRAGTHCAEPIMQHFGIPGTIRASFAFYNTPEEIDRLVAGLHKTKAMLT